MQDLNDLYFFAQVVEHGGFAAAARALGMPRSRLSRRIGLLEDRLGVRLIHRSTSRFAVTEIGHAYHGHCVAMLVEAEAAQEAIDRACAVPQGIVRVSCPTSLLYRSVGPMLARFMAENPKVELHLEGTDRCVDVIHEGFDIALRMEYPPLEQSDLVMKVLSKYPARLVASPTLFERFARPLAPTDLSILPSLTGRVLRQTDEWHLEGPNGATVRVPHRPCFVVSDVATLRLAALHGVGIVGLPMSVIGPDVREGRLVDALPGWALPTAIAYALFPSRRGLLPSVRALLDFLAAEFAVLGPAEPSDAGPTTHSAVRAIGP